LYPATASRAVLLVGTVTQPGRHSGVGLRLHGLQRGDSLFRTDRRVRQDAIALLLRRFLEVVNFSGKPVRANDCPASYVFRAARPWIQGCVVIGLALDIT